MHERFRLGSLEEVGMSRKKLLHMLLGRLRMPDFFVSPDGLRNNPVTDLREKAFYLRDGGAVFAPPYATIIVKLRQLVLGYSPIHTLRRACDLPPRRRRDWIATLAIVVSRREVSRLPISSSIPIGIAVSLILIFGTGQQIDAKLVYILRVAQNIVVVLR